MTWEPNDETTSIVQAYLKTVQERYPWLLEITEFVQGCDVADIDPYGVGVGTYPRLVQVQLRGEYNVDAWYREDLGIEDGDVVTIMHFRDGEQYEILRVGGSSGGGTFGIWPIEAIDPMGFENRTDSAISFTDLTKTFAITGTYNYWNQGNKIIGTGDNDVLPAATDIYYYYYDAAGVLQRGGTFYDLFTQTPVAYVYYNNTLTDGVLFEERHGISMDVATHYYAHTTRGAVPVEGFAISGYTLAPPAPVDANNSYAIATGDIADEDLERTLAALADGGPYTVWYRSGAAGVWEWFTGLALPFDWTVASYIDYNQWTGATWQLTALGANQYVNYYMMATNAITAGHLYVLIPGQTTYTKLDDALQETLADLAFGDFPIIEGAPLYRVTYRTSAAYGSTGKCRTEVITRLIGQASVFILNNIPAQSHAVLADRDLDNQHPSSAVFLDTAGYTGILSAGGIDDVQAAMNALDGQATNWAAAEVITALWKFNGGVVFNEGAANVDLRVEGTTEPNLFFIDASANRVGIGTSSPQRLFHVLSTDGVTALFERDDTGQAAFNHFYNPDTTDNNGIVLDFFTDTDGVGGAANQLLARMVIKFDEHDHATRRASLAFRVADGAGPTNNDLYINYDGRVGVNTNAPTAKLHVDQSSTTEAIPVLLLDQADLSEEMIEFATTIGVGNPIEAVGGKTLTTTHFIKITIPGGLTRYIPCGTIA